MNLRVAIIVSALWLLVQPAAAEDFIKGTYSSAEGCAALKANTQGEGDFIFLNATGFEGIEFNCQFLQLYPRKDLPGWLAIAFCEEPGLSYPGLFTLMPLDDHTLSVGTAESASPDDTEEAPAAAGAEEADDDPGLDGEYQLCAAK